MNLISKNRTRLYSMMIVLLALPPYLTAQSSGGQTLYQKPYLIEGKNARLGGYIDHEFKVDFEPDGSMKSMSFTPHRLIPFIFSEIAPGIRFITEIEFEYGGNVDKDKLGELKIEFAIVDMVWSEALTFRAGIILLPLGRFNLLHDSPVNDFTERPLVSRHLIPTTFMESGAGIFGSIYPTTLSMLSYELYVVNGLGGDVGMKGIRGGRPPLKSDNNQEKNVVGRLGFSPFLGLEVGGSVYAGRWNAATAAPDTSLGVSILALDWSWEKGPFQLIGEAARASYELPPETNAAGWGGYAQLNFHFGHELIRRFPVSVFTASLRLELLDLNEHALDNGGNDQRRLGLGLNFRPVEDTALKISYLWNETRDRAASTFDRDQAFNQIRVSVATYF